MARGGINKALVVQARQELLRKGINPSIDAIRVQLGNTGSKTTILRYLKEIDTEEGTTLDDKVLLSNTLKKIVSQLASQLHSEAKLIIEKNEAICTTKIKEFNHEIKTLKQQLVETETQCQSLDNNLHKKEHLVTQKSEENQVLQVKSTELQEKVNQMIQRIEDKDHYIASLEEKHKHSREALEHYRQSVKEQRQQDLRAHEQHIQQLQVEQRSLNQTLIVKQENMTQLNTDNSRLVTELKQSQKENGRMMDDGIKIEKSLQLSLNELNTLNNEKILLKSQMTFIQTQVGVLSDQNQSKETQLIQLKDQINQKNKKNRHLEQEILIAKVELKASNTLFKEIQKLTPQG